jgi:thiamine-phosphate pyrophosphorylase
LKKIEDCHLYGILDLGYVPPGQACGMASRMIEGGVDVLQLRAKNFTEEQIQEIGADLVSLTGEAGIPFIINDFPEIVPAIGAQGAHVGQDDRTVDDARWRAGRALAGEVPPPLIGKSTHSVEQAAAAAAEGADYIGFGPLFATPTKPGRPAIGLGDIGFVHECVKIPVFCIGGIKLENLAAVLEAGARRVVVVSGILQAPDVAAYCRSLKSKIQNPNS